MENDGNYVKIHQTMARNTDYIINSFTLLMLCFGNSVGLGKLFSIAKENKLSVLLKY